ncbi:MAG: hypothetical protein HY648_00035 [Acidobacteria bacterium]|nr:hypothetical protein [Acidobacteriota bacterium]
MRTARGNFLWTAGLAAALVAFQAGCQQAEQPATESGNQTTEQPATAPKASSPATAAPSGAASRSSSATASAPQPAASQGRAVTLASGTALKVRPTNTLSTESHNAGDTFLATLEEPLVEGGVTVAPKGSTVEGRIVEADKGGRVSGVAHLTVALNRLHTADGEIAGITTNPVTVQADTTKTKDATKIAIGTGVGAAIGAIAGGKKGAGIGAATGAGAGTGVVVATRGDAAEIGSETVLTFTLASPLTVTAAR